MPEDLSKEQEEQITRLKQLKQDYLDAFSGDIGKRIFEDLSKHCFVNKTTFSKEAIEMAYREGQRSVLLHIQNMQKIDIDKTKELMKQQGENKNE